MTAGNSPTPPAPAPARRPRRWVYTLGGAGLLKPAPGTWGSLVACLLLYFPLRWTGGSTPAATAVLIAGLLLFSGLAVISAPGAVADLGRKDPGPFVLDEAAGICVTLLFQPMGTGRALVLALLVGFMAFRLFDVTKPPPARQLERLPAGWGILLDDLAAGVYANITAQIILRWLIPAI